MQRRSTRSMKKPLSPLELESSKPVRPTRAPRKSNLNNSESESSDSDFVQKKPKKTPRKRKTNRLDSNSESSDNEENFTAKSTKTPKKQRRKITSSSSESDIENYLKPASEIDLNSSFFNSNNKSKDDVPFDAIEKEIFSDIKVTRLSDSDSSGDEDNVSENVEQKNVIPQISINDEPDESEKENHQSWKEGEEIARLNFQRLQDYSKKMEEAKKSVEQYQAKQLQENVTKEEKSEETLNIEDLLAIGESKTAKDELDGEQSASSLVGNVGKDPYSDSEQEDWEEIDEKPKNEESLIPNTELQITVEMPSNMKRKKGVDLLAAVKRRLNRIRKENQLLIHKVHSLCWIAHGNYVNNILNDQNMLASGLSLMPSEKSFPSKRLDLDYLEQILKWYKKTVKLSEKNTPENKSLETLLEDQIENKEAYSKGMLAMIFIIILRSLGVQCRLVLSLQVESLRPPNSDLHFVGNPSGSKEQEKKIKDEEKTKSSQAIKKEKEKSSKKKSEAKTTEDSMKKDKIHKSIKSSVKENNKAPEKESSSKYFKETKKSSKQIDRKDSKVNEEEEVKKKDSKLSKTTEKNDGKEVKRSQKDSVANNKDIKSSDKKNDHSEKTKNTTKSRQSSRNKESSKEEAATKEEKSKSKKAEEKSKSKKTEEKSSESKRVTRAKSKSPSVESQDVRSKSASTLKVSLERIDEEQGKHRSKSSSSTSKAKETRKRVPQLDGMDDSDDFKGFKEPPQKTKEISGNKFEQFYSEIYNRVSNKPESSKVNLKNSKSSSSNEDEDCKSRKHRRSVKKPTYVENTSNSEDDFEGVSPKKKRRSEEDTPKKSEKEDSDRKEKVNLQKLKDSKSSKSRKSEKKSPQKTLDIKEDIMNLIKGRIQEQKHIDRSKMVKKRKPTRESESEDSDYAPEPIRKKYQDSDDEFYPKSKVKKRVQTKEVVKKIRKKKEKPKDKNSRKVISSDSEYTEEEVVVKKEEPAVKEKKKRGNDVWLEVFLEMEEKWISVDVVYGQAHCVNELYSRASHPVSYVLAWNNSSHVKDITRRYCQNFNTVTRKLRIEAAWWEESLKPFLGPKNARDREEDDELDRQQQEKPSPTTISEYKNHPSYALERHSLKFEASYPPNAAPLGFVRNEPVYSRDCVFICHSRDIWLKQAKVVKRKEQPYKIVKARPKYDKLSNTMITDQNSEIFGPWQVEDYDPPTAENGNVPRNAFGNVDLFKECMSPKKCVHLRSPGSNKTARRLNIDCATAIVGFDFHGGWSHPVYDGFVVCEEFEDESVAAWNIEQEEQERKDQEKYEKRVYGNWKKLIRGSMIRERSKAKYGFGRNEEGGGEEESDSEPKEKKSKVADSEDKKTAVKKKTRRIMSDSEDE